MIIELNYTYCTLLAWPHKSSSSDHLVIFIAPPSCPVLSANEMANTQVSSPSRNVPEPQKKQLYAGMYHDTMSLHLQPKITLALFVPISHCKFTSNFLSAIFHMFPSAY